MSSTRTTLRRGLRRTAAATALAAVAVLAAAGSAAAHVTVHPESYAKGASDGTLSFRVPNEENNAGTTKVQIFLPTDHPVLGVLVAPIPGWTATTQVTKLKTPITTDDGTVTEAVSEVDWTKGTIQPGQYQDFTIAFGRLPDNADQLEFKALQTYSDGKVVRWIEQTQAGQAAPANPAPVLTLTAAASGTPSPQAQATPAPAAAAKTASANDSTARGVGIAGLVVGVLGVAAAAFAISRSRSTRS